MRVRLTCCPHVPYEVVMQKGMNCLPMFKHTWGPSHHKALTHALGCLWTVPSRSFQYHLCFSRKAILHWKRLTVKTCFYIGEMFHFQCSLQCTYASSMYASTHAHKHHERTQSRTHSASCRPYGDAQDRQLWRDKTCTYLAHHELGSVIYYYLILLAHLVQVEHFGST